MKQRQGHAFPPCPLNHNFHNFSGLKKGSNIIFSETFLKKCWLSWFGPSWRAGQRLMCTAHSPWMRTHTHCTWNSCMHKDPAILTVIHSTAQCTPPGTLCIAQWWCQFAHTRCILNTGEQYHNRQCIHHTALPPTSVGCFLLPPYPWNLQCTKIQGLIASCQKYISEADIIRKHTKPNIYTATTKLRSENVTMKQRAVADNLTGGNSVLRVSLVNTAFLLNLHRSSLLIWASFSRESHKFTQHWFLSMVHDARM